MLMSEGVVYGVSYSDYSESLVKQTSTEKMLDSGRDGALANTQSKLLSESAISLDGYPGREITASSPDGKFTARVRVYLVNSRLYQTIVVIPNEVASSPDVLRFLDSFHLLPQ